jgi:lysophospholipase L1-like esterase
MHSTSSILFIGDSLTEWFNLDTHFPETAIVNEGIAGDTTFGLLERIDDIMAIPAASIFLMIGINDILNGYRKADIIENYQLLIEEIRIQSNHSVLVIQSILPVNESMLGSPAPFNRRISDINAAIKEYCDDCGITYLNLYNSFLEGNELNRLFTTDGAHLSQAGYRLWAEKLKAFLE